MSAEHLTCNLICLLVTYIRLAIQAKPPYILVTNLIIPFCETKFVPPIINFCPQLRQYQLIGAEFWRGVWQERGGWQKVGHYCNETLPINVSQELPRKYKLASMDYTILFLYYTYPLHISRMFLKVSCRKM